MNRSSPSYGSRARPGVGVSLALAMSLQLALHGAQSVRPVPEFRRSRERVRLQCRSQPLSAVLQQLSTPDQTLRCDLSLSDRRLSLFSRTTGRGALLDAIAWTVHGEWDAGPTPVLRRSPARRAIEMEEDRQEKRRLDRRHALRRDALRRAIVDGRRPECDRLIEGLLASRDCPSFELVAAAALSEGAYPLDAGPDLRGNSLHSAPLGSLTPAAQGALKALLSENERQSLGNSAEHSGQRVHLIAAPDGLRVALTQRDGTLAPINDAWSRRSFIPELDSDVDVDPLLVSALGRRAPLRLSGLSGSKGTPAVAYPKSAPRRVFADVWQRVHHDTGQDIVADDWAATRICRSPWLLTDRSQYMLDQLLTQVINANAADARVVGGCLAARTLLPAYCRQVELNPELVTRLRLRASSGQALSAQDYWMLAELTDEQLYALRVGLSDVVPFYTSLALFGSQRSLVRLARATLPGATDSRVLRGPELKERLSDRAFRTLLFLTFHRELNPAFAKSGWELAVSGSVEANENYRVLARLKLSNATVAVRTVTFEPKPAPMQRRARAGLSAM